ncbi:tripartite motif-containing protein 16-like [Sardina pilchardus]|uniref:tripartite motif-containing protein 16-like n=1 Tax=Sardina pilchardus TaxID=27697 RepID=UPI002E0EE229
MADSTSLKKICSRHKKKLEIFCRNDQIFICSQCKMDEHKGHETVSAAEERRNKQGELKETQRRFQQRIQQSEKEMQELRKAVEERTKSSAQTAVEDSERIFTEMIRSIERKRHEVQTLIRAQEAEVKQAEEHLKQLEQEINELKQSDAELEKFTSTEDDIYFLENIPSIPKIPRPKDSMTFSQSFSLEALEEFLSTLKVQLKEELEGIVKQEADTDPELPVRRTNSNEFIPPNSKYLLTVSDVQAVSTEPVTREEFLKYSCHFTLDPNTAQRNLHLSEGNRRVERRDELQSYPDHPERFDVWWQVLCREGVSGRCYWEVEWSGQGVDIAVSYKSISRKGLGIECMFGRNDQSWMLQCYSYSSSYSFWHNNEETKLPLVASSRIGVYVDHGAGTLAFYSISDTMTLLHRVQTTFTHTLYPGFWLYTGSSLKLF